MFVTTMTIAERLKEFNADYATIFDRAWIIDDKKHSHTTSIRHNRWQSHELFSKDGRAFYTICECADPTTGYVTQKWLVYPPHEEDSDTVKMIVVNQSLLADYRRAFSDNHGSFERAFQDFIGWCHHFREIHTRPIYNRMGKPKNTRMMQVALGECEMNTCCDGQVLILRHFKPYE